MRRRDVLLVMAGSVIGPTQVLRAQQKALPVIGFLGAGSSGVFAPVVTAFHQGLKDTGWAVGQNVAIEYRWAEGAYDRLPALAAELVSRNVDVIATSGGIVPTRAAKTATSTIPIVFETGADPIETGLIASFARPGGNLTGVTVATSALNAKRLELLSELVPQADTIALLVNPNSSNTERIIRDVREAAGVKGVQLHILRAGADGDFELAFVSLGQLHARALLVGNDPFFFSRHDLLVALAARHAVPAIYEWREFVTAGGLASYGTSITGMYRQLGMYVGRVLAGAKPADLPIYQPTKFELIINVTTAKALGLTVPESLRARIGEFIE
jgi:putative ABC transport system substrate-binding protein